MSPGSQLGEGNEGRNFCIRGIPSGAWPERRGISINPFGLCKLGIQLHFPLGHIQPEGLVKRVTVR